MTGEMEFREACWWIVGLWALGATMAIGCAALLDRRARRREALMSDEWARAQKRTEVSGGDQG